MSGFDEIYDGGRAFAPPMTEAEKHHHAVTQQKARLAVTSRAIREQWDRATLLDTLGALGLLPEVTA